MQQMAVHQGKRRRQLNLGQCIYWPRQVTASDYYPYVHILYVRCEDAILVISSMSLPISTTTAGEF